jgi:hypothetical protein
MGQQLESERPGPGAALDGQPKPKSLSLTRFLLPDEVISITPRRTRALHPVIFVYYLHGFG